MSRLLGGKAWGACFWLAGWSWLNSCGGGSVDVLKITTSTTAFLLGVLPFTLGFALASWKELSWTQKPGLGYFWVVREEAWTGIHVLTFVAS